ncbi:DNA-binding response regulator [Photobacterium kishitanii]|uniref:DNA-binding response regulator n=1 Tax=Photobacterium kishitanii TaxID=318456 RepID=A0A2T3R2I9_9GAMM|nr:response regulator [Photobacterium kishitanii]KJG11381.1 transcriptional regulator [Photobacterium kishitanii]KJG56907.1 transcriptional regulator [Photobacterium kishitanii]KJG62563.1 transcriptional regulator [Photobacterium kishitanii]KJG66928.1 transcriptional regulator [Photobacterium kishitanii]KJG70813.1 transcriptional regulator [Photobacterium kishitanii]
MRILIVEDDAILSHHLKSQLSELGNQVQCANNAEEGLFFAQNYPNDIAIVDIGLPDRDGISLIKDMRKKGLRLPIMILTARSNWQDKVTGLEAGADDYLVKPFQKEEMVARLSALVRRSAGFVKPEMTAGDIRVDLLAKQVYICEELLELTAFEYDLLEYLMRHSRQVVSKQRLLDVLYEDQEGDPNTIEVMISRLRKKFTKTGQNNPISTIRGQGYIFELNAQ